MKLDTKRLLIRPIQANDKEEVFAYRSDAETNKYQGFIPKTLDEVALFIAKSSKEINVYDSWFQFVIISKENHSIIGDIGVRFVDEKQAEFGCTLSKKFQHKGFATEAVSCILNYLFLELDKHRIFASIDPENIDSIRLSERLGFRKEAHFLESLFLNGKWVDDIVYALLKREWKS